MSETLPYLPTEKYSEERIIQLLKAQDRKAISLVFEQYGALLLNVIKRVIKDPMMAEEVLQKVLIKIWKHAAAYEKGKGSLFTWLVSISRNAAIDQTRTKDYRLSQESERSLELISISDKAEESDQIEKMYIKQLLGQLPDAQKKLIDLSFFDGYSHKEIAQRLDMPLGTVKTRIRQAIIHLRSVI